MRIWATKDELDEMQRQNLDLLRQVVALRRENAALAKALRTQDTSAAELARRLTALENGQRPPVAPVGFGYEPPLRPVGDEGSS